MKKQSFIAIFFALQLATDWSLAAAQGLVRITPLVSHEGKFCANDRALLLDPTGLRIL